MNLNKLGYSRTVEVDPKDADLLNRLMDRFVMPVLEEKQKKRQMIAQGAIHNNDNEERTLEEQIEALLNFGRDKSEQISVPPQAAQKQQPKIIAQGGLNENELKNLDKILRFGYGPNKPAVKEEEGATGE